MNKIILYVLLFFITFFQNLHLQPNTSEIQISAVRSTENIKIDGRLTENIWNREGFSGLEQQDPDQGQKPSQKSVMWVAYDDYAIYFAAKFYDSAPDSIMSRLVRRDFIWGDPSDGCVLYLDPFRDKRNGYFFYVSAAGTLADGLIQNDEKQPNDLTWDAVWEGVHYLDSDGWSVEIKIPFSQLRFKDTEEQVWGINAERFISRRFETDMIAYTPRNESGFASRFPELIGIKGISPSARLELLPYSTSRMEYIGNESGNPFNNGADFVPGAGLDIKASLGRSLTLDGTINPDFGQVEVDPAIVNLTDVEHTFQEKRPFFTEGVTIFNFGRGGTNSNWTFDWSEPNIFYSRRIGRNPQGELPDYDYVDIPSGTHILGAGKITGKVSNDWNIGMIHALTKKEFAEISVNNGRSKIELEPLTYYGVFRAQRDFNAGKQGLGILSTFTNRFFDDGTLRNSINKDALVAAADGWTFLDSDRTYVLSGWVGASHITGNKERITSLQQNSRHYFQRPDVDHINVDSNLTSLTGYGGRLVLNKNRGRWTFNTSLGVVSPKFELNDIGFGPYSDKINTHFVTSYRWQEPTNHFRNAGINAATYLSYDFGGNKTAQGYRLGGFLNLHDFYGINFNVLYNPSSLNARRTRGGPLTFNPIRRSVNLNMYTDNRVWWVLSLGGSFINGDDLESNTIYANVEFKALPTLTLSVGPEFSRDISQAQYVDTFEDETALETFGNRYVFAHLDRTTFSVDIRADWIISPKLSFQVYFQPFIGSGEYSDFKSLRKPKSYDFVKYGEEGSSFEEVVTSDDEIEYTLDADGNGPAAAETISNPDFNYISLRGNAVFRWEYLPGSALYLVWTQSREEDRSIGEFRFNRSINNLFQARPDNIFMLKISYWFGL